MYLLSLSLPYIWSSCKVNSCEWCLSSGLYFCYFNFALNFNCAWTYVFLTIFYTRTPGSVQSFLFFKKHRATYTECSSSVAGLNQVIYFFQTDYIKNELNNRCILRSFLMNIYICIEEEGVLFNMVICHCHQWWISLACKDERNCIRTQEEWQNHVMAMSWHAMHMYIFWRCIFT